MISVDPGLNGTGWARWEGTKLKDAGIVILNRGALFTRMKFIGDTIFTKVEGLPREDRVIVCEFPQFFDTVMGQMVARRGDLVKLATLIGHIAGQCSRYEFIPITVNQWKGTLPKSVVEQRVRSILGAATMDRLKIKSHAVDAVGIGLYHLGRF